MTTPEDPWEAARAAREKMGEIRKQLDQLEGVLDELPPDYFGGLVDPAAPRKELRQFRDRIDRMIDAANGNDWARFMMLVEMLSLLSAGGPMPKRSVHGANWGVPPRTPLCPRP